MSNTATVHLLELKNYYFVASLCITISETVLLAEYKQLQNNDSSALDRRKPVFHTLGLYEAFYHPARMYRPSVFHLISDFISDSEVST